MASGYASRRPDRFARPFPDCARGARTYDGGMQTRRARSTLAIFVLRFAALFALTVAVLASVSVRASREPAASSPAHEAADTATAINSRRYPLHR